ncbi:MAG: hypothetical protein K2P71_01480 [Lachnospiraceae bacterium]|jgi:hypothetical protein|nr:hypothetical protein [Lachnospiraceae bacterium]MDE6814690.1 hypothetical protein [Lachnospiraceae bacterium]
MDNFMEKIAQKLNSQDMIRANSAADAAELENLKNQITLFKEQMEKYDECLQEMRKLNLRNIESAKGVQELTQQAGDKLEKTAGEVEAASVSKIRQTSDLSIAGIQQTSDASIAGIKETSDVSIAGINQAVEESLAKIAQIKEHSEDLEKIGEAMTELQGKIEQSFKSLEDFSHTDNVKVYRNVQAAVIEELEKQTLELKEEQKKSAKNSKTALIFAIITMILGIADTAILLAMVFQII